MATISNNDIARAIYLATKDNNLEVLPPIGGKTSKYAEVVQFLFRKRLLSKTPEILLRLEKIINEENGVVIAKVSSKNNLSEKIKGELIHFLNKKYTGKKINIVSNLDEKVIGGFKIEVNDEVVDLTIKNKIGQLQEYLI